ncbi:MAG: hypothetical protein WC124_01935 [Desulfoplanes sp.]
MGAVNETGVINLPCAAIYVYEGYAYVMSSGQMVLSTAVTDDVLIAAESSIDDEGNAKLLTAGQTMPFYLPSTGKVVKVASLTGITYTSLCPVYLSTTDGVVCVTTDNSTTLVGHYTGPNNVATASTGDLIDVVLDTALGGYV